jgi:hypothetical protein
VVPITDNVAVTAGSGTTLATDDVSGVHYQKIKQFDGTADSTTAIIGNASGELRVADVGNTPAGAQVTVTNTTTQILAADSTRKEAILVNRQTVAIYIGATAATTSMFRVDPGESVTIRTTARVDGITSAAYTAVADAKVHTLSVAF